MDELLNKNESAGGLPDTNAGLDVTYWICCNSESPEKIYFDFESAVEAEHCYIEMFDKSGNWVNAMKLVDGKYTNDF